VGIPVAGSHLTARLRRGYSVALALGFFAGILNHHDDATVTWSAGQERDCRPARRVEADFVLCVPANAVFRE